MKNPPANLGRAFTLIELLVVISIIGILAALLLPVFARIKVKAQIARAQLQIGQIANAILKYDADYGKFPVSTGLADLASKAGEDLTYGGTFKTPTGTYDVKMPATVANVVVPNSEVMAVLLDMEYWPAAPAVPTINLGHVKNPQRTPYLSATMPSDINSPGIGPDGVYRDPWKNPYVITIDLNFDHTTRDAFYCIPAVSTDQSDSNNPKRGLNGLIPKVVGGTNVYEANSPVMVWSAGPDQMIDPTPPPDQGANKNNVLSWK